MNSSVLRSKARTSSMEGLDPRISLAWRGMLISEANLAWTASVELRVASETSAGSSSEVGDMAVSSRF